MRRNDSRGTRKSPLPVAASSAAYGERARVRGGNMRDACDSLWLTQRPLGITASEHRQNKRPPLTLALSPLRRATGRGDRIGACLWRHATFGTHS
jgi:hypothetical protein